MALVQVRFILRADDETTRSALDPLYCDVLVSFAMPPFENLERIRRLFSVLSGPLPSAHGNANFCSREVKFWQIDLSRRFLGSRLVRIERQRKFAALEIKSLSEEVAVCVNSTRPNICLCCPESRLSFWLRRCFRCLPRKAWGLYDILDIMMSDFAIVNRAAALRE